MEKMIEFANKKLTDPFSKAIFTILMVSYIQPFEDGNKRASRLFGKRHSFIRQYLSAFLQKHQRSRLQKSGDSFYEQNSARFFKELFIEQFKFAVGNYFWLDGGLD